MTTLYENVCTCYVFTITIGVLTFTDCNRYVVGMLVGMEAHTQALFVY
jgi:hypothetical protein